MVYTTLPVPFPPGQCIIRKAGGSGRNPEWNCSGGRHERFQLSAPRISALTWSSQAHATLRPAPAGADLQYEATACPTPFARVTPSS